jgi:uncharacterized protein DUF4129
MGEDSLRAVLDSVFAGPDYRWVERPGPLAFLADWLAGLQRWLLAVRETHPLGFRLLLAALVILLVVILVHVGWILFHTVRASGPVGPGQGEPALRRDRAWYRREADRLAAAGCYVEAMQADFLALVLALDAFELLRFHPGKTPAEYSRESRLAPGAREEFRELVHTLYGYAFARWPCGAGEFASWRARSEPERYARAV